MDGFFGIGLPELFLIAVIALIVLGPERLPGTLREIAKFLKQVRAVTSEFSSQFSEELKVLDDLNPRKLLNEATDPNKPDPASKDKNAKTGAAASPGKKTTTANTPTAATGSAVAKSTPPVATSSAKTASKAAIAATVKADETAKTNEAEKNAKPSDVGAPSGNNELPSSSQTEQEARIAPPEKLAVGEIHNNTSHSNPPTPALTTNSSATTSNNHGRTDEEAQP
jgi:Tat protein translocase TatB subunit